MKEDLKNALKGEVKEDEDLSHLFKTSVRLNDNSSNISTLKNTQAPFNISNEEMMQKNTLMKQYKQRLLDHHCKFGMR